jgi:hypothetical protein
MLNIFISFMADLMDLNLNHYNIEVRLEIAIDFN